MTEHVLKEDGIRENLTRTEESKLIQVVYLKMRRLEKAISANFVRSTICSEYS